MVAYGLQGEVLLLSDLIIGFAVEVKHPEDAAALGWQLADGLNEMVNGFRLNDGVVVQ